MGERELRKVIELIHWRVVNICLIIDEVREREGIITELKVWYIL